MVKRSNNPEEECFRSSFERGEPNGTCWGDGHYECLNCINYLADFKKNGWEYRSNTIAAGSLSALHVISVAPDGAATISTWDA